MTSANLCGWHAVAVAAMLLWPACATPQTEDKSNSPPNVIDGVELVCLRENEATRQIPVLAISANAMPKDVERGKAAGFVAYMTKPIDVAELLRTVTRLLATQQAQGSPASS